MNRVLIDTNIYSQALRGDISTTNILRKCKEIGLSVVSIAELLAGFKLGNRFEKNLLELKQFLDSPRVKVYPIDEITADYYSEIFMRLKRAGTPIPTNDIWISAVVFQNGLKLFTEDRHFKKVEGLFLV